MWPLLNDRLESQLKSDCRLNNMLKVLQLMSASYVPMTKADDNRVMFMAISGHDERFRFVEAAASCEDAVEIICAREESTEELQAGENFYIVLVHKYNFVAWARTQPMEALPYARDLLAHDDIVIYHHPTTVVMHASTNLAPATTDDVTRYGTFSIDLNESDEPVV